MEYLRVKNWGEFQQYKDDRPLHWIKLHIALLDDYGFDALSETAQLHLLKIWMLAGKLDNRIPNDARWIGRKIGAQSDVPLQEIVSAGFLVPYEIVLETRTKPYGDPTVSVPREEKRREEKSREEKRKSSPRKTRLPSDWQPNQKLIDYCREKRPDLNPDRTFEDFRDYYHSHGKTMADWDLTAMRWVRNERSQARPRSSQSPVRETPAQRRDREAREALEAAGYRA